jgi:MFS family permease
VLCYNFLIVLDFGNGYKDPITGSASIKPDLRGLMNAAYSLGAISGVPFAPVVNQWLGRRWTIMMGSCIMVTGAILQGFSQNSMPL